MTPEERHHLRDECERRIDVMEAFETSEEWTILATFLDAHLKQLENIGKGLRRRVMRPVAEQPAVTIEQIAAHEARIDETALLRRLPRTILAQWRDQVQQLDAIRASST